MSDIKPIETVYNGYRFRSRLEARWAVFFDAMGIKYEYEPEGFYIDGEKYLPDFFLPEINAFVEIKSIGAFDISQTDCGVRFEDGREIAEKYAKFGKQLSTNGTYIIVFGDPIDVLLCEHIGKGSGYLFFTGVCFGSFIAEDEPDTVAQCDGESVLCKDCVKGKCLTVCSPFLGFTKTECILNACDGYIPKDYEHFTMVETLGGKTNRELVEWLAKNVAAAEKARQARFEHGECG